MAVLAMDTATDALAVAVGSRGDSLASACLRVPRGHSRLLQPTVAQLLTAAGIAPADLTGICVGVGPGSYTGVRMAVSTAKAMATALGVPLYTVSTLVAIANAAVVAEQGRVAVLPLLYARRERAFGAVYTQVGADTSVDEAGATLIGDGGTDALHSAATVAAPPQVKSLAEWAEVATSLRQANWRIVTVHDLRSQKPQVQTQLAEVIAVLHEASDAVADLADVAPGIGPALLRLTAAGAAEMVSGDAVHDVAPDYALAVEAEVKLAERSDPHGNR
ncbi:tRNA (adenosine(37)-N6)-threonylcarbamoyltransferase complex dimerization subunit type 1 TsaB [Alicyclobacillus sp. ALC3]|uniref:tRNA (adenosine(37)-N6)-threonylcarbamoyltransferase complex dimerization subunit type 1 TsaB n=1 Tax=Alicyclobacillus sp. ALC3 TaxID=2796143 RepID=UPI00237802AE|nr:tRNA (adenosine(37)-N6)-threonylcarbamoyltransferase complex dimerization subunit type 1 TsaB [Alicyclobacillus sp. ALC3]WDL95461.1 tRNA (adenosine(37)-N6)-threonylcarbamoyltransferase complex dimerization subunit type 1 TsaB [Alicyclobacillus sp. ALC3]